MFLNMNNVATCRFVCQVGLVESVSVEGAGLIAVGSAAMEETEEDTVPAPAPARWTHGNLDIFIPLS